MLDKGCFETFCFVSLDPNTPKLFGFSELLSGLALIVLAWTVADFRYRFRVKIAPIPIQQISYWLIAFVGCATLLTDLWIIQGLPVLEGSFISIATWQAMLAGTVLVTFLAWSWFAYISPPVFSNQNSKRYAKTLYQTILRGVPDEMAVAADELSISYERIALYAFSSKIAPQETTTQENAKDILQMMADRRLCKALVISAPSTIIEISNHTATFKYSDNISSAAPLWCNIFLEALIYKDSFLYHETSSMRSGLIGSHQPISQSLFSDSDLIERIHDTFSCHMKLNPDEEEAYSRAAILFLRSRLNKTPSEKSKAAFSIFKHMQIAVLSLYDLQGNPDIPHEHDAIKITRTAISLFLETATLLRDAERKSDFPAHINNDYFDTISECLHSILLYSAFITNSENNRWFHRNEIWGSIFSPLTSASGAIDKIHRKLRRNLYNEIARLEAFPNFSGSRAMSICLKNLGATPHKGDDFSRSTYALHKALINWIKNNYGDLHDSHPEVAKSCLPENFSYNKAANKIIITHSPRGLRRTTKYSEIKLLDPTKPQIGTRHG